MNRRSSRSEFSTLLGHRIQFGFILHTLELSLVVIPCLFDPTLKVILNYGDQVFEEARREAQVGVILDDPRWQLLVRIEALGVDPDARNALDGWEATPHQRFERLLRDTGVFAGLLTSEREERKDGQVRTYPEFRLIYALRGETSGHQSFPIRLMALVSGRSMLSGLKLLLDRFRLFSDGDDRRLPALLKRSRDAQALVSTALNHRAIAA